MPIRQVSFGSLLINDFTFTIFSSILTSPLELAGGFRQPLQYKINNFFHKHSFSTCHTQRERERECVKINIVNIKLMNQLF